MVNHEGSGNDSVLDLSDQPSRGWSGLARMLAPKGALIGTSPFPPTEPMSAFLIGGLLGLAVGLALRWLLRGSQGISRVHVSLPVLKGVRPIRVGHLARVPVSRR